jgi:hypothetical protein
METRILSLDVLKRTVIELEIVSASQRLFR